MLLGLGDVGRDVGVLCRLEIWPPPVSYCVFDDPLSGWGGRVWSVLASQGVCHDPLETLDVVFAWVQLTSGQLEESRSELEKEDVGKTMLVDKQNTFNAPSHPDLVKFVPHPLEPGRNAWVLLKERVLGPKCVVGQGVKVDLAVEGQRWVLDQA